MRGTMMGGEESSKDVLSPHNTVVHSAKQRKRDCFRYNCTLATAERSIV